MKPIYISHLALLLSSVLLAPQTHAIPPRSGQEGQQSQSLHSHSRAVLRTAVMSGLSELDPGLPMSSLTLSDDETEEEEKENEKAPVVKAPVLKSAPAIPSAEAHRRAMQALQFLKYQGFEGVEEAYEEFHKLLADIQTMADPTPTLQRLVDLSEGIGAMAQIDEFLEKREAAKALGDQVQAMLSDAQVALDTYGRAAAESFNAEVRELYEKDSQRLQAVIEDIERRFGSIYRNVIEPEASEIFSKLFDKEGIDIVEIIKKDQESFYDELMGVENLLGALRIDLEDLQEKKKEILWERDLAKFNQKIDDFLREKNRFLAQVDSIGGRVDQVGVCLKNFWSVSRLDKEWKEAFEDAADKFQKLEEQVPDVENAIPENLFELDGKVLAFAAINQTHSEKLPEILVKIAKKDADYAEYNRKHANVKLFHRIYDQLHRQKAILMDFDVLYKKADSLEKAFKGAWHAQPGSVKALIIAREVFDRAWGPTEDDLEHIRNEVEDLKSAANKARSYPWRQAALNEEADLQAYEALKYRTSKWTLSALIRHYDEEFPSKHRNDYRSLVKGAKTTIISATNTLDLVLELRDRLEEGDGASEDEYVAATEAFKRQTSEAQKAVNLLQLSQALSDYQNAKKDAQEKEVFQADMEERKVISEQLSYLIENSVDIFYPEERM